MPDILLQQMQPQQALALPLPLIQTPHLQTPSQRPHILQPVPQAHKITNAHLPILRLRHLLKLQAQPADLLPEQA
jgi:hypothetical protein